MKPEIRAATASKAWAILFALAVAFIWTSAALSQTSPADSKLEEIISGIETRYSGAGFAARFDQRSILKAMDITDTAFGSIVVKRPGKMRWTYESPEKQVIVSDGTSLWIYKPEDNQVAIGRAPAFFAGGKGAGFLSDMQRLREKFDIRLENGDPGGPYVLNLIPVGSGLDIAAIYLTVSPGSFEISRIVTYNAYGDENRIDLKDIVFKDAIDDALFSFDIPEGADILKLEEAP